MSRIFKKDICLEPSFSSVPALMMIASILGAMSTTILAPALPLIEAHFHVTSDAAQQVLSLNLAGIAVSGLFYGALSESFGRRFLFLSGISLFFISAFLSYFARTLEWLMIFQLIQGCGMGVGTILPLAVIRDLYHGKKAAKLISVLGILVPLAPAFSPLVGGYITQYLGWSSIFLTLSIIGVCLAVTLYFHFPETLAKKHRQPPSLMGQIKNYGRTLKNLLFLRFMAMLCLSFSGLWVYHTSAPFVFIQQLKLSPAEYGVYPIISVIGVILGNFLVNRMVHFWQLGVFLKIGAVSTLGGTLILLGLTVFSCRSPLIYALSMTIYCFGFGTIFSSSLMLAMENASHGKGYGAALMRGSQLMSASIAVAVSGILYKGSFLFPGLFMLGCIVIVNCLVWTTPKQTLKEE